MMKSAKPMLQVTAYYGVLGLFVWGIITLFPAMLTHLPIGGVETLDSGVSELMTGQSKPILWDPLEKSIRLGLALVGVLLLMEPVAWIYMGARRRKGREQAFVLTILLLPVVVAGIVMIVQNSLALAFSLAGIVAGVRFRLTLDDTLDAIYIFVAIGAGLAAGIEALEITIVITMVFNYMVLLMWEFDYAEQVSVNRWFTKTWMNEGGQDEQ
ncbi:MAG: hypothetical protein ACI9HY_002301 [Planctomycetaceae bacterium]|jgi:hypothetical protein